MYKLTEQDYQALVVFTDRIESLFASNLYGIILYGSKARGDATADSDIDLLLILDERSRQNRVQVNQVASRVSLEFDVLLLPHVVSWAQWQEMAQSPYAFFSELFKDGWPIYGEPSLFKSLAHYDASPLVPMLANA